MNGTDTHNPKNAALQSIKEFQGLYVALYQDFERIMTYLNVMSSELERNVQNFSKVINGRMHDLARRIDSLEALIDN